MLYSLQAFVTVPRSMAASAPGCLSLELWQEHCCVATTPMLLLPPDVADVGQVRHRWVRYNV